MDLLIQVLISISLAIIKGAQAKGNDHLLLWDAWGAVFSSVLHATVWKNEKFTLTEKIFREINYLAILLVNAKAWT